jgi:CheY-like chemotaxis protein
VRVSRPAFPTGHASCHQLRSADRPHTVRKVVDTQVLACFMGDVTLGNWNPPQPLFHTSVGSAGIRHPGDHILLVEDDHALAQIYRLGMLLHGFHVDVAPDGEAGIQRVQKGRPPDAIVLDLGLPRVDRGVPRRDGLTMLSVVRAREATQSIPVVVLANDPQDFKDVLELGATACLARWRATVRDLTGRLDRVLHGGWLS